MHLLYIHFPLLHQCAVLKFAFLLRAVGPGQYAVTAHGSFTPLPGIDITVGVVISAGAVEPAVEKLPVVAIAAGEGIDGTAGPPAVGKITFITSAALPCIDAFTVAAVTCFTA